MKKIFILTWVLLAASMVHGLSQSRVVTGRITDASDDSPLVGASVVEEASMKGTVAGADGSFSLRIDASATSLHVSFLGYEIKIVPLSDAQTVYDVALAPESQRLENVVVVGYGTQRKESVVGSISQITAEELGRSTTPNLTNALAGRAAGLITIMGGGQPGDDASTIYVRGQASPNHAQPLVLVDGMEKDWKEIDAVDIESFSVLKDASATAVFGVRGANGVILISTKRGQTGKPTLRASYQSSFQQAIRLPNYLRSYDYAVLANEALRNDGKTEMYTDADLEHYRLGDSPYTHPDNDYYKDMLNNMALQHVANASVSGGTDLVKYYISANFTSQEGLYRKIKNDNYPTNHRYRRTSIRSNLDFALTKTTTLGVDLTGRLELRNQPNNNSAIFDRIQKLAPNWQPYINPDGSTNTNTRDLFNPTVLMSQMGYRWRYRNVLEGGVTFTQKLDFVTQGLSFKVQGGYNGSYVSSKTIKEEPDAWAYMKTGQYESSLERVERSYETSRGDENRNTSMQASFNYARKFSKHDVTGLVLYLVEQNYEKHLVPVTYLGWVGRATYGYDNRYLFEVNAGYNGSTNFAKGKRFALFPAVSAGWVLSEEKFFKDNVKSVNFLKIRGSYGEVGNDKIGGFGYYYKQTYYLQSGGDGTGIYYWGVPPASSSERILIEGKLGNENVTWERARKSNIGIDLRMFNSKLSFSGDYFYEKRVDILGIPYSVPLVLGMGNPNDGNRGLPPGNINKVENRGFDFEIGYNDKVGSFRYYVKGNFTFARNRYLKVDEDNAVYEWQSKLHRPIGQIFGLTSLGLYQRSDFQLDGNGNLILIEGAPVLKDGLPVPQYGTVYPGDLKYKDLNGDGIIDQYDRGNIGRSKVPEYSFGLTLGGEFKGFDFNILFQGSGRANMQLSQFAVWEFYSSSGSNGKVMKHHMGRYNPEDSSTWERATYPLLHYGTNTNNHQSSTYWLYDRSYIRLKNAEIGYTLPRKWMDKINMTSVRIFASGTNLFTWDHLLNWDPESASETGSAYPQMRTWTIGLNVTF